MRKMLVLFVTLILCVAIATVARYDKEPQYSNGVETAATAAPPRPVVKQPTAFGINLSTPVYWSRERSFMNLTAGGVYQIIKPGWPTLDPKRTDANGTVLSLEPGENVALSLTRPARSYTGDVEVRCRYQGRGRVEGNGMAHIRQKQGQLDFVWRHGGPAVQFRINETDPANPIRNIDCRETDADPNKLFDPGFIDSLRPFKVVRFLDWQQTNVNVAGDWAHRTAPDAMLQSGPHGVAVEHLVAMANEAGFDPWFVMPWKADRTYMENFARYVHDHLDPKRTVYVEIGNEVWNRSFAASREAAAEGIRLKLGANDDESRMRYYAQKSVEGLVVWERVFKDRPEKLVRILASQNAWADLMRYALDYKDTASHIDALSTAIYFGFDAFQPNEDYSTDTSMIWQRMNASMDSSFNSARTFKKMADDRGLRYIVYEGGQHLAYTGPDRGLMARLGRDPRMGEAYRRYLAKWDREFGDTLMLFHSTSPIGANLYYGLREYSGQPLSETPKRKAVLDAIAALPKR